MPSAGEAVSKEITPASLIVNELDCIVNAVGELLAITVPTTDPVAVAWVVKFCPAVTTGGETSVIFIVIVAILLSPPAFVACTSNV